jgi:hypothetical protein
VIGKEESTVGAIGQFFSGALKNIKKKTGRILAAFGKVLAIRLEIGARIFWPGKSWLDRKPVKKANGLIPL